MEKRLVLALLLSLVAIFVYSWLFMPKPQQARPRPPAPAREAKKEEAAAAPAEEKPSEKDAAETAYPKVEAEKEEPFVLETERHRAVFTNRGAVLRELRLKDYFPRPRLSEEERRKDGNWLLLLSERNKANAALRLTDPFRKLGGDPATALWRTLPLPDGVEYEYSSGNGVTMRKRVEFVPGTFHARVALELENQNGELAAADWILEFSPTGGLLREPRDAEQFYAHPVSAVAYREIGGDYELATTYPTGQPWEAPHAFPAPSQERAIAFAGNYNKYFAALCRPTPPAAFSYAKADAVLDAVALESRKLRSPPGASDSLLSQGLYQLSAVRCGVSFHVPLAGGKERKEFLLYLGPKDGGILRDLDRHPEYEPFGAMLDDDAGTFGKPMLWILKGLWFLTRNYGIAIILLTLLVRAAMFPLSRKQQISTAAFQKKVAKVQPELKTLEKKYANDKRKRYEEQAKLFKQHGINPASGLVGCLPLLLQLPIFFGLFKALNVSFDLRQASFLWVADLSQPDQLIVFGRSIDLWIITISALNVLPIAMVVVWILQMRSMPTPADPQAAQMMKIQTWFPLIFGFMLYNYAAGLSLYMTVSSLSGIVEQKFIKKRLAASTG